MNASTRSIAAGARPAPRVKSPLSSRRPAPSRAATPVGAEPVELVDGAQHRQPPAGIVRAAEADRLHDPVEHLAVVDLDDVIAAPDAEPLHAVGRHQAHLGIGRDRAGADRIGVELQELPEPPRARLLVAEHRSGPIGAVGLGRVS